MAIAYLNEGAVSLAAANWSDAIGFAEDATLVIPTGSQTVTTSLDQSAVTNGIDTLDILPGFTGRIGGAGYGSLKLRATSGVTNRVVYNAGGGSLYLQAAGAANTITTFWMSSLGSCYLTGGTFTNLVLGQGSLSVDSTTEVTTPNLNGGSAIVQAGTAAGTATISGGSHVWKRGFTTMNVYGRGRITIDAGSTALTTLSILSPEAEVTLISSGTITTVNNWGRLLADKITRDITITNYNSGPAAFLADSPSSLARGTTLRLGAKNI
jgi:hypothetical protein